MKAFASLSVDQTEAQQWVWRLAEAAISRTTETAAQLFFFCHFFCYCLPWPILEFNTTPWFLV